MQEYASNQDRGLFSHGFFQPSPFLVGASVLHAASSRGMNVGAKQATRSSGWLVLRSQVTSATPHIRLFDWPSFNSACGTPGKQGSLWL